MVPQMKTCERQSNGLGVAGLLALITLLGFATHAEAQCELNALISARASNSNSKSNCSREATSHPETRVNDSSRWSLAAAASAASIASEHSKGSELDSTVARSLSELHFADSHDWINNPPEWVKAARNYKRQGMPILHLVQSESTSVALGLSNKGKPGLYFTRKVGF